MKNKTKALIITYISAAFVVLSGFTVKYKLENDSYKNTLYYNQMQAMSQLSDCINNMSQSLMLGIYAYSPETLSQSASQVWHNAMNASACISAMPLYNSQLEKTKSFINTAGDWAEYIALSAASGRELSDEERRQIKTLFEKIEDLSEMLYETERNLYSKDIDFEDETAASSFEELESGLSEFSFADYDGKLSDKVLNRGLGELADEETIDEENAAEIAAELLNSEPDFLYKTGGDITSYVFTCNNITVEISENGGHVLSYYCDTEYGEAKIKASEAIKIAGKMLEKCGYNDMLPVYYQIDSAEIQIEFVYVKDGIRFYPDSIYIEVSLSDGAIERISASEYLVNHKERDYNVSTLEISAPSYLESYETIGFAIINTPGLNEMLCTEILCKTDEGKEIVIYTDTETNTQKLIKQIDKSNYGTFIV